MDTKDEPPNYLIAFGEFVFEGTGSCKLRLSKLNIVEHDRHFFVEKWRTPVDAKNAQILIHVPRGEPFD